MSREERTGWRDERISLRHRYYWGFHCPAVDVDFLMIEYDTAIPIAIVEYKHEYADLQLPSKPSYRAIRELANRANLPFFAARYAEDFSTFTVTPLNSRARQFLSTQTMMNEVAFVTLLYRIRGRALPESVKQKIGLGAT